MWHLNIHDMIFPCCHAFIITVVNCFIVDKCTYNDTPNCNACCGKNLLEKVLIILVKASYIVNIHKLYNYASLNVLITCPPGSYLGF